MMAQEQTSPTAPQMDRRMSPGEEAFRSMWQDTAHCELRDRLTLIDAKLIAWFQSSIHGPSYHNEMKRPELGIRDQSVLGKLSTFLDCRLRNNQDIDSFISELRRMSKEEGGPELS